jgi:hypothetical protein
VGIVDLDFDHPSATALLNDPHVRLPSGKAVLRARESPPVSLTSWAVGRAEHFREQGLVARLAVTKEHYPLRIREPGASAFKQAADELFVPHALYTLEHQPTLGVYYLGFPALLVFAAHIAPAFIGL